MRPNPLCLLHLLEAGHRFDSDLLSTSAKREIRCGVTFIMFVILKNKQQKKQVLRENALILNAESREEYQDSKSQ